MCKVRGATNGNCEKESAGVKRICFFLIENFKIIIKKLYNN